MHAINIALCKQSKHANSMKARDVFCVMLWCILLVCVKHTKGSNYYPRVISANLALSDATPAGFNERPFALQYIESQSLLSTVTHGASGLRLTSTENDNTVTRKLTPKGIPYAQLYCSSRNILVFSYARPSSFDLKHAVTWIESIAVPDASDATSQLDFSRAFATRNGTFVSDLTWGAADCTVLFILDGVNRVVYSARVGETAFAMLSFTNMLKPTSIEMIHGTGLLIADWGTASIYLHNLKRDAQEALTLLAGNGETQQLIADGSAYQRPSLSGPTQMTLFKGDIGVFFTDRNPILGTSALRLLRVGGASHGQILTLAGGNTRAHENGPRDTAKLQASWGLSFSASSNQILIAEPLESRVRVAKDIAFTWELCAPGFYLLSNSVMCVKCEYNSW
jgi:hypothetical protein